MRPEALTPEECEIVETVKRFVARDVAPVVAKHEREGTYPDGLVAAMKALGLFGIASAARAQQVEAQRLALDEEKGRLLDARSANAAIDEIAGAMRDALLNWPARVSGLVAAELGVDPHLVQTVLQQHITDLLTEAADRFDPPALRDRGADG